MLSKETLSQTISLTFSECLKPTKEEMAVLMPQNPDSMPKIHQKVFIETFQHLSSNRHHLIEVWKDFVLMAACALSNPLDKEHFEEREKRYLQTIQKYSKQEQKMFPELLAYVVMALEKIQSRIS